MKANEFIKNFGIERVEKDLEIVNKYGYNILFTESFTKEIKRLVQSYEVVEQYNGIFEAKELIRVSPKMTSELRELAAAIIDVESCL